MARVIRQEAGSGFRPNILSTGRNEPGERNVTQPPSHTMTPRDWGLLLLLSLLWGGSFLFVGIAVGGLPPLTIVFLRVTLAAVALHAVLRVLHISLPRDASCWRAFLAMGLLNNAIPFSLIVWGQTQIASGLASILNATTPLFTVLAAHWLTSDERMTRGRVSGVMIGFAGVIALIGPEALRGAGTALLPQLAVLAAACSYACAGLFGRRFRRMGVTPLATATGQVTASSLCMLPVALLFDRPWTLATPDLKVCLAVLALALLSTALAYFVFFRILATAGAVNLSLVTFLIPVSAMFMGAAVLGERVQAADLMGLALIGVGLAAIDGRATALLGAALSHLHIRQVPRQPADMTCEDLEIALIGAEEQIPDIADQRNGADRRIEGDIPRHPRDG